MVWLSDGESKSPPIDNMMSCIPFKCEQLGVKVPGHQVWLAAFEIRGKGVDRPS